MANTNICIVGFAPRPAEAMRGIVVNVLEKIGKTEDTITTILHADTKWCFRSGDASYLIVRDTDLGEAEDIARALHTTLNLDIEFERIGFFGAIKGPEVPA